MTVLVLGVLLWTGAHLFKRVAPDVRANMGNGGRGAVALAILVSIVLMVIGFRWAPIVDVWYPPSGTLHLNNLLVLIALYLMSPAPKKGKLLNGMRHPMLAGMKAWALAHLLVNGDLASIILFGGLLIWAVLEVVMINRTEPEWTPGAAGSYAKDAMFLVVSVVLLAIIGWIHGWLGPWPFPG